MKEELTTIVCNKIQTDELYETISKELKNTYNLKKRIALIPILKKIKPNEITNFLNTNTKYEFRKDSFVTNEEKIKEIETYLEAGEKFDNEFIGLLQGNKEGILILNYFNATPKIISINKKNPTEAQVLFLNTKQAILSLFSEKDKKKEFRKQLKEKTFDWWKDGYLVSKLAYKKLKEENLVKNPGVVIPEFYRLWDGSNKTTFLESSISRNCTKLTEFLIAEEKISIQEPYPAKTKKPNLQTPFQHALKYKNPDICKLMTKIIMNQKKNDPITTI
jgi:hypothetical protein